MSEEMIPLRLCVDLLMANETVGYGPHAVCVLGLWINADSLDELRVLIEQAVREMAKGGVG